jgi:hypothetical protein
VAGARAIARDAEPVAVPIVDPSTSLGRRRRVGYGRANQAPEEHHSTMRHQQLARAAAIAVLAACAAASAPAAAPAAGLRHGPRQRYARVRDACRPTGPRRARCFAQALVPVPGPSAGARPYLTAAGAAASGPAGGLTPAELASAYAYSPAGGGGQTVALVDAYDAPTIEQDLATFDANYGLPACTTANGCFAKVGETGSATSLPKADTRGWSVEIALDVETVHSVCQQCKVLLVEASTETLADLARSVTEAVKLGATEISNSYGALESQFHAAEEGAYNVPGVVVTASSGDSGYLNWDFLASQGVAPGQADAPATLPQVVAVGGTALSLDTLGKRTAEAVWNDSGRPNVEEFKQFSATGGGCSGLFAAPSWQLQEPGWAATGCATNRLASDVAAVGDPYTGFDIYDTYAYEPSFATGWMTVGGTSLSSPIVSALYALAGGSRGTAYPAATLYAHSAQAGSFYDVTEGGDGYCDAVAPGPCGEPEVNELLGNVDCEGTTSCDAAPGFDGPSGVGAPNGLAAFASAAIAPGVSTGTPTSVTAISAIATATVNPNGQTVTACAFEYGTSTAYGTSVPCASPPGSGVAPVAVAASLVGLAAATPYHFRIVATNASGTAYGADASFTTPDPPEYGRCVKVAKGTRGAWSTSSCTVAATPERSGYEWEPGPGPRGRFTTSLKPLTVAVIETTGARRITCSGESGSGEYSGPRSASDVRMTFTGCKLATVPCTSPGSAEGEIATALLAGTLGIEQRSPEGPLRDRAALDLLPAGGSGPFASFACGSSVVTLEGSVLGPAVADKPATHATLRYVESAGRQRPEGFEGFPADVLVAAFGEAAPEQAAIKLTGLQVAEEAIEVNTVA